MSLFPRPSYGLCIAAFFASLALVTWQAQAQEARSISDVEKQISETNDRLKALDAEIENSRVMKARLAKAVAEAQSRVGEREQRLQGLEKDIARYNNTLDSLQRSLADAQQGLKQRRHTLAQALRDAQVVGQQTPLKIVLQNDDPAIASRIGVYTDYVLAAQKRSIEQQAEQLKRIETAHANALKDRNWLNYIKKKASKQREAFASTASSQQRNLGEVEASLDEKTRTVAQLKADQSRLQSLMEELKAMQSAQSGYFAAGKGRYPAPVAGKVLARFGEIKSVGKLRWSGLFIAARTGLPVQAVADGEVVYSNWLQGFGQLVIIDHGDNYATLYGGNRDVRVSRGDWVQSGATIATVGDSGGQNASGVYFEIRHNAQAEDPESWLSPDSGLQKAS